MRRGGPGAALEEMLELESAHPGTNSWLHGESLKSEVAKAADRG